MADYLNYESYGTKYVAMPVQSAEQLTSVCTECDGHGWVEGSSYSSPMEVSTFQCPECCGLGEVALIAPIPQQNVLPSEALIASNELPF